MYTRDTVFLGMKSLLIKLALFLVFLGVVGGATAYFAMTGGGQIDVNETIVNTNQEGFARPVLPNTQATQPNGGLRPMGGQETPLPPAQPEPEQQPAATSTESASSTEGAPAAPEGEDAAPAEETPAEGQAQ